MTHHWGRALSRRERAVTDRGASDRGPCRVRGTHRETNDDGGVWIVTATVLGVLVYALIVLMAIAGFTVIVPLVVVPPVLLAIIAGSNLLGGRSQGRPRSEPVEDPHRR